MVTGNIISFDDLIYRVLEKAEQARNRREYAVARAEFERVCNLYSQHPTGNPFIEERKLDLYRSLFER